MLLTVELSLGTLLMPCAITLKAEKEILGWAVSVCRVSGLGSNDRLTPFLSAWDEFFHSSALSTRN